MLRLAWHGEGILCYTAFYRVKMCHEGEKALKHGEEIMVPYRIPYGDTTQCMWFSAEQPAVANANASHRAATAGSNAYTGTHITDSSCSYAPGKYSHYWHRACSLWSSARAHHRRNTVDAA